MACRYYFHQLEDSTTSLLPRSWSLVSWTIRDTCYFFFITTSESLQSDRVLWFLSHVGRCNKYFSNGRKMRSSRCNYCIKDSYEQRKWFIIAIPNRRLNILLIMENKIQRRWQQHLGHEASTSVGENFIHNKELEFFACDPFKDIL